MRKMEIVKEKQNEIEELYRLMKKSNNQFYIQCKAQDIIRLKKQIETIEKEM